MGRAAASKWSQIGRKIEDFCAIEELFKVYGSRIWFGLAGVYIDSNNLADLDLKYLYLNKII